MRGYSGLILFLTRIYQQLEFQYSPRCLLLCFSLPGSEHSKGVLHKMSGNGRQSKKVPDLGREGGWEIQGRQKKTEAAADTSLIH